MQWEVGVSNETVQLSLLALASVKCSRALGLRAGRGRQAVALVVGAPCYHYRAGLHFARRTKNPCVPLAGPPEERGAVPSVGQVAPSAERQQTVV